MLEFRVNVSAWNHVPQVICTQTLVPARGCHSQPKRLVIGVRYCLQITNPGQFRLAAHASILGGSSNQARNQAEPSTACIRLHCERVPEHVAYFVKQRTTRYRQGCPRPGPRLRLDSHKCDAPHLLAPQVLGATRLFVPVLFEDRRLRVEGERPGAAAVRPLLTWAHSLGSLVDVS